MDVSKEKEAREHEKKKKGGYDMRLIDADALMRVVDAVPLTFDGGVDINELETIINEQPTIEPIIVRCKDCKYHVIHTLFGRSQGWCERLCDESDKSLARGVEPDDYCSRAERGKNEAD